MHIKDPGKDPLERFDVNKDNADHGGKDTECPSKSSVDGLRWDTAVPLLSCRAEAEIQHDGAKDTLMDD